MAKKQVIDVKEAPEGTPKVGIVPGNVEVLKVKLLGDISMYLKRIAEALEKE